MAKKPIRDVHADMAEQLDRELLRVLKEGDEVMTEAGPIKVRPSAAKLNQVRNRLKDLGIQSAPLQDTAAGNLVAEARKRGLRFNGKPMPPVNTEDPDAATA